MASNQASMARRQRERARMQQAQEKLAKRAERREQKKSPTGQVDNPMDDPTIDWGGAVREIKLPAIPDEPTPLSDDDPEVNA
jgi:sRNA-binding protein